MNREQAKALVAKYNRGEASQEEIKLLENWYATESLKQQSLPEEED